MDYYNIDAMNTFKTLVFHQPMFREDDLASFKNFVQIFLLISKYRIKKWFHLVFGISCGESEVKEFYEVSYEREL